MEQDSEKPISNGKQMVERNPDGTIKKGTVLNPNGRPQGSLDFKTKWYKMIEKIAQANDITPDEVELELIKVGYKKAKEGDYSFYRDAMDRIHGKPMQPTDITTNGKDLPVPLLNALFDNNSNKENSQSEEKN